MAENVYDGSLLDDFDGVEDVDCDIDDLDKVVNEQITEEAPIVEETITAETTVPEVKESGLDGMSLEELESLLIDDTNKEVIEEQVEATDNKGDLNVAIHQERQKSKDLKSRNDLLSQEIDLIKQQLELAKLNGSSAEATQFEQPIVDDGDILAELQDSDVISKADLQKILNQQKTQQAQITAERQAVQSQEKGLKLVEDFRSSHNGKELGVLSFDNIDNLVKTGKVQLTDSQIYLIQNAVNEGLNPAELAYNMVIEKVPALKQQKFKLDIQEAIRKKSSTKQIDNVVNEPVQSSNDDFTARGGTKDTSSHLDSLCDW